MEHVAALLLILGCSEGTEECGLVQDRLPQFETVQSCEAQREPEALHFLGEHPVVVAQCVPVDPANDAGWTLSWYVAPNGAILASTAPVAPPPRNPIVWI